MMGHPMVPPGSGREQVGSFFLILNSYHNCLMAMRRMHGMTSGRKGDTSHKRNGLPTDTIMMVMRVLLVDYLMKQNRRGKY